MVDSGSPQPNSTLRPYTRIIIIAVLRILAVSAVLFVVDSNRVFLTQLGFDIGIVLLLLAVLLQPNAIHLALVGRPVRYGSVAVVKSLAFIGIVIFINFISLKSNLEYDLTATGQYTLSDQTIEFLQNLDEPVQVVGFFQAGDHRWRVAQEYLERYGRYTNHLTYALYDPNVESALAKSYELGNYGMIFVSGMNHYQAHAVNEQAITTGLMLVTGHSRPASISAKTLVNRQLFLTPLQAGITFVITIIAIPLAALIAGVKMWWINQ